ncbi:MAG: VWA domain-containing protein [Bryobacteraceae bacterium]|nr:VWA domain-containing protein [Bryobacteraceae bacterium]
MIRSLSLALGYACFATLAGAQSAAPAPPDSSVTVKSSTQEVVLDMVFRDKKGRAVTDIKPEEVHVSEDGTPQTMKSFRMVTGKGGKDAEGAPGVDTSAAARNLDPMKEIRLVTLVFENLDQEGKRFFRGAVKDLLAMAPEQNLYFAVYTIDQKLHCIQPFTNDHKAMNTSLDKSAMYSLIQYQTQSARIKESLSRIVTDAQPLQGGSAGGPSASAVGSFVNARLAQIQFDMLQNADRMDRQAGDRVSLLALLNMVREQAKLPGRKTVLYFNPWFTVPESAKEIFESVKSTANRANVSFYSVDSKGLTTWSQNSSGLDQLTSANKETRDLALAGGVGAVSESQARAAETGENSMRSNPMEFLRQLAESTGGVAFAETNDWKAPLRVVLDEVRTYYEATYSPQVETLDGKFRKIAVKVDRSDVVVHARNGYFALPSLRSGEQLMAYEVQLLNALNMTPVPSEIAYRASAMRFNTHGQNVEYMLSIEVPMQALTFQTAEVQKVAKSDASLLAVLKDEKGEIVSKFSKDFPLNLPLDKLEAYKAGNLTQTFRTELTPGNYTLETVVIDRTGNKTGVTKSKVVVPASSTKLSLSDIAIVRRADVMKDNEISDAFYYEGGKVVPSLSTTMKGGPGTVLPFYFVVYRDTSITDAPKLKMSFYMDGQLLAAPEAPLPPPQKDGRIPFIASLPGDGFAPGNYEMRVTITQGPATAEQKVAFTVN